MTDQFHTGRRGRPVPDPARLAAVEQARDRLRSALETRITTAPVGRRVAYPMPRASIIASVYNRLGAVLSDERDGYPDDARRNADRARSRLRRLAEQMPEAAAEQVRAAVTELEVYER